VYREATLRHEFPDKKRADSSYSHDLRALLKVAGLQDVFAERSRVDEVFEIGGPTRVRLRELRISKSQTENERSAEEDNSWF
jgi:hypothetical protein